jgi:hypothetical protein
MNAKRLLVLTLLVLSVSTVSFAALINPISASVDLSMGSNAGCGTVFASSTQSWGVPLSSLSASASAVASCTKPNRNVETSGSVTANWNNARSGNIKFNSVGWVTNKNVSNGSANANLGTDYSYTFSPTKNDVFTLNYNIVSRGNNGGFGLNGFFVTLNSISFLLPIDTSGSLNWTLLGGINYTLTILNEANISGGIPSLNEHMNATFKFSNQAATPEPSSLLLLGSGVLALAATLRKKFVA